MSQVVIGVPGGGQMTVSAFLLATLDFKESFYPYCALIMVRLDDDVGKAGRR